MTLIITWLRDFGAQMATLLEQYLRNESKFDTSMDAMWGIIVFAAVLLVGFEAFRRFEGETNEQAHLDFLDDIEDEQMLYFAIALVDLDNFGEDLTYTREYAKKQRELHMAELERKKEMSPEKLKRKVSNGADQEEKHRINGEVPKPDTVKEATLEQEDASPSIQHELPQTGVKQEGDNLQIPKKRPIKYVNKRTVKDPKQPISEVCQSVQSESVVKSNIEYNNTTAVHGTSIVPKLRNLPSGGITTNIPQSAQKRDVSIGRHAKNVRPSKCDIPRNTNKRVQQTLARSKSSKSINEKLKSEINTNDPVSQKIQISNASMPTSQYETKSEVSPKKPILKHVGNNQDSPREGEYKQKKAVKFDLPVGDVLNNSSEESYPRRKSSRKNPKRSASCR